MAEKPLEADETQLVFPILFHINEIVIHMD
jgi:hypothetical protein